MIQAGFVLALTGVEELRIVRGGVAWPSAVLQGAEQALDLGLQPRLPVLDLPHALVPSVPHPPQALALLPRQLCLPLHAHQSSFRSCLRVELDD